MRSITLLLILTLPLPVLADAVLIAAVAGNKKPLVEIYALFERSTGTKVEAAFGNMQQVMAQTRNSGRVDLVVGERGFLEKTGLFERYVTLGVGRLVLAYGPKALDGYRYLADSSVERIALPDPKKAIYGKAAIQFLARSGLMPEVKDRLMMVATVSQVSAYLIAGTVDAGFINITDAVGIKDKIAGFEELPVDLYDPLRIVLAFPKGQTESESAKAFETFLESDAAKAILTKYGL